MEAAFGSRASSAVANGPAEGKLERGDVILEVNRSPIHRASDLTGLVKNTPQGRPVLLKVNHSGKALFVAIDRS